MSQQIVSLTPDAPEATLALVFPVNLVSIINLSPWDLVLNYSAAAPDDVSHDRRIPAGMSTVLAGFGQSYACKLLVSGSLPQKILPCYVSFSDGSQTNSFGQLVDPIQGVNVTMLVRIQPVDYNSGDTTMAGGFSGVINSYTIPTGYFGVLRAANLLLGGIFGVTGHLNILIDGYYAIILRSDPAATPVIKQANLPWEIPCPAGTVIDVTGVNPGGGPMAYAASWFVDLIPLT